MFWMMGRGTVHPYCILLAASRSTLNLQIAYIACEETNVSPYAAGCVKLTSMVMCSASEAPFMRPNSSGCRSLVGPTPTLYVSLARTCTLINLPKLAAHDLLP